MQTKRRILASQIALKRTQNNEEQLERELRKFFNRLGKDVLEALNEYWQDYQLLQGHIDLICSPIHEAHKEYYTILEKYIRREYKLGQAEARRLVNNINGQEAHKSIVKMPLAGNIVKGDNLFATMPKAETDLLNRTFKTSENTLSRIDNQVNKIVSEGYTTGKGINDVGKQLTDRFNQLETWEAKRIARTEINTSHNQATYDTYQDLDVEYTQWVAAEDDRTRETHLEINGEIVPIGTPYSNGLMFPGDMSGDIEEWINCRCSNAPFVMPYGYMAPPFTPFRESDLIPIDNQPDNTVNTMEEVDISAPTTEQTPSMLQGNYETFNEYDKRSKAETTVYRFENGFEIGINAKAEMTFEEVRAHIEQLPEPLKNIDSLKRIDICGHRDRTAGGRYTPSKELVEVFLSAGNKSRQFDTLNHELAHALDYKIGSGVVKRNGLSVPEIYEDIFKADNKLHTFINERTGRKRTPKIFVTDYAARSFTKYKKRYKEHMKIWENSSKKTLKPEDFRFGEDFADSTKKYLNPTTHEVFIIKFPNRAEYLEGIYGKPVFNENSPHSLAIKEEEIAQRKRETKQQDMAQRNKKFESLSEKEFNHYLKEVVGEKNVEAYYTVKAQLDRVVAVRRTLFTGEPQFMIDAGYPPSLAIDYVNNPNKYLNKTKKEYEKYKSAIDNVNNLIKQML